MSKLIRIVTRESPLALWQANHVKEQISLLWPDQVIEILGIKTQADNFMDMQLASLGGKGAFVKELQQALLDNKADLAVHSMKDVTVEQHENLYISAIMVRESPTDCFISNKYSSINDLPSKARIGTSSLRRRCQLMAIRTDLIIGDIRGNVGTRLDKLDDGDFDALILATAGRKRLGFTDRITQELHYEIMLPAIGQGALGVETRRDNHETLKFVSPLNDTETNLCVTAERAVNQRLYGGCHSPIAAYARIEHNNLKIAALVGMPDGSQLIRAASTGSIKQAETLGHDLGDELLNNGADVILQELRDENSG